MERITGFGDYALYKSTFYLPIFSADFNHFLELYSTVAIACMKHTVYLIIFLTFVDILKRECY